MCKFIKCSYWLINFCGLTLLLDCCCAYADNKNEMQCQASGEYLAELARSKIFMSDEKDFSCLTDITSLEKKLPLFQLIDTRQNTSIQYTSLKGSWVIPVRDLKSKLFLQKRQLLLIDDGFSRVSAAQDCATLKKAGFSSVNILIGGVDAWNEYKEIKKDHDYAIPSINSRQLLVEYFNGKIVIVATSKKASEKLSSIGFTNFYTLDSFDQQKIFDLVVAKTNGGFDPIVIVSEDENFFPYTKLHIPNLYRLSGGVSSINSQIKQNLWINLNRSNTLNGGFCGPK